METDSQPGTSVQRYPPGRGPVHGYPERRNGNLQPFTVVHTRTILSAKVIIRPNHPSPQGTPRDPINGGHLRIYHLRDIPPYRYPVLSTLNNTKIRHGEFTFRYVVSHHCFVQMSTLVELDFTISLFHLETNRGRTIFAVKLYLPLSELLQLLLSSLLGMLLPLCVSHLLQFRQFFNQLLVSGHSPVRKVNPNGTETRLEQRQCATQQYLHEEHSKQQRSPNRKYCLVYRAHPIQWTPISIARDVGLAGQTDGRCTFYRVCYHSHVIYRFMSHLLDKLLCNMQLHGTKTPGIHIGRWIHITSDFVKGFKRDLSISTCGFDSELSDMSR